MRPSCGSTSAVTGRRCPRTSRARSARRPRAPSRTTRRRGCRCPTRTGCPRSRRCSRRRRRSSTSATPSTSPRSKRRSHRRPPGPSPTTRPPGCRCPTTSTTCRRSTRSSTPTPRSRRRSSPRPRRSSPTPWPRPRPPRHRRRRGPSPTTPPPGCRSPAREALPAVTELLEDATPAAAASGAGAPVSCPAPRVLAIALLVVATVLGGGWAVTRLLRSRRLPGHARSSTAPATTCAPSATTVGALLRQQHVQLGRRRRRRARPRPAALHDGLHVDVLRAFPVTVDLDGTVRTVRTVETQRRGPGQAVEAGQAHRGAQPARLGSRPGRPSCSARGISGTLKIDSQSVTFDSPSRTVDELLQSYNVHLGATTSSCPRPTTVLSDGATVTVVRVGADVTQELAPIPYDTVQQPDPDAPDRPDPGDPGRRGRHHDRHLPPADRERRRRATARSCPRCRRSRRSPADHRLRHVGRPALGRARAVRVGWPLGHRRLRPRRLRRRARHLREDVDGLRRRRVRPDAGLATREQQIIVGPAHLRQDRAGTRGAVRNNVLHWPRWSM